MTRSPALGGLTERAAVAAGLQAKGLAAASAADKAELFGRAAEALGKLGLAAARPAYAMFVPGRIEVLGKHTDYAGGRSVVAAADRGFCLIALPRDDATLRLLDVPWAQERTFEVHADLAPAAGDWSNYPMTVGRRVARNFSGRLRGADVAFGSDLPSAGGMSSSSALLVASFLVLRRVNDLDARPEYRENIRGIEDLAGYLGTCENGQTFGSLVGDKGVGTFGGSEDHTAILCCRPDCLSCYSYCPVRFETLLPLSRRFTFAVASSGVVAEKTGQAMEKYNRASRLARAVVEAWNQAAGRRDAHLAAALASAAAEDIRRAVARASCRGFSGAEMVARFDQFFEESQTIIPAAGRALARDDMAEFGRLVDRSQQGAERLLGNQVPETVFLAASARQLGAAASSAFGAGFGGSVWALVESARAGKFVQDWSRTYRRQFPQRADGANFFLTRAGPSAFDL